MFCCNCLAMFCSQCSVRNALFAMLCSQLFQHWTALTGTTGCCKPRTKGEDLGAPWCKCCMDEGEVGAHGGHVSVGKENRGSVIDLDHIPQSPGNSPQHGPHDPHGAHGPSDGEDDHEHYEISSGGHGGHGHGGHGHEHLSRGQRCINFLFGEDHTSFEVLIKDVSDSIRKEHDIRSLTRHNVIRALKRELEEIDLITSVQRKASIDYGVQDMYTFVRMQKKARAQHAFVTLRPKHLQVLRHGSTVAHETSGVGGQKHVEQQALRAVPTADHHVSWDTKEGEDKIKQYAMNFYEFMRTKGGTKTHLLQPVTNKIGDAGRIAIKGKKKNAITKAQREMFVHEITPTDMLWGINVLYKLRLHVGDMTEDNAKTLMRALDINGDNHLTKDEWLLFLFPKDVQELGDLDEERETLRKLKKRLLTVRWGERGGGGWCWGNGWWGCVVGVCGWLSPNVLFRIFFDCFDVYCVLLLCFNSPKKRLKKCNVKSRINRNVSKRCKCCRVCCK